MTTSGVAGSSAGGGLSSAALSRMTVKGAALPESTVSATEAGYFGRKIKLAGERSFQNWDVTVYNDENWVMRAMLEAWSNGINRMQANVRDPRFDIEGYKTDMVVRQYAKVGTEIRSYQMIGAWPAQVSGIKLDWDDGNKIETFDTIFAYDYWLPLTELGTDGAVSYADDAVSLGSASQG